MIFTKKLLKKSFCKKWFFFKERRKWKEFYRKTKYAFGEDRKDRLFWAWRHWKIYKYKGKANLLQLIRRKYKHSIDIYSLWKRMQKSKLKVLREKEGKRKEIRFIRQWSVCKIKIDFKKKKKKI